MSHTVVGKVAATIKEKNNLVKQNTRVMPAGNAGIQNARMP
jgi:hypothetical protein